MNNVTPSWDQISGGVDRILLALMGVAVGKGWISSADAANLVAAALAIGACAYGFWVNRQKALVMAASNIVDPETGKKTIVVTSDKLAVATPDNSNILSASDVKVTNK